MKNKLKLFLSNGFISFDHLLDLKECKKLFNILKKNSYILKFKTKARSDDMSQAPVVLFCIF